jgi:hypothetical protein
MEGKLSQITVASIFLLIEREQKTGTVIISKRSGGVKKEKNNPLPSSHKIRQLSKSPLHQNK